MGLDMYAYTANKAGQHDEFFKQDGLRYDNGNWVGGDPSVPQTEEIAYWRKHPNLHGWMEQLWQKKNPEDMSDFNCVELELTLEDINDLEEAVTFNRLPSTTGFFFGNNSDSHYFEKDIEFIERARLAIDKGKKVFYNSSW